MGGRRLQKLTLCTVDAFTSKPFTGNQAAICLDSTEKGLDESIMQSMAAEMNISETAFLRPLSGDFTFKTGSRFGLRWFTPTNEVPLCGHATLASAATLFQCVGVDARVLEFETLSGVLKAERGEGGFISMDLPLNEPQPQDQEELDDLLKLVVDREMITDVQFSPKAMKLLVRLKDGTSREFLETLKPDVPKFMSAHSGKVKGVIVTVKAGDGPEWRDDDSKQYHFMSRYFAPWNGIPEDPVTGSAHTVLGPYWSKELKTKQMYARQCSPRGGDVQVEIADNGRVIVAGRSTIVVEGTINVPC